MAARAPKESGPSAVEIIEEAVALLRKAPAGAHIAYYLGAIPFWLGVLYFLSDMSRNGFAAERLTSSSLGVALLFIWMKCWHAVFAANLRAGLLIEAVAPWTGARIVRLVFTQAALQPWGLLLRPLALTILLPFSWVSSFFQNVTILGDGTESPEGSAAARAWKQTLLWPGGAHLLILTLGVFGFFVWINIMLVVLGIPILAKVLFGIETMASRGGVPAFFGNTTFLMVSVALTGLCLDPLWKTAYVLRCFHGDSRRNGGDLRLQLRTLSHRAPGPAMLLSMLALACFVWTPVARAAFEAAPSPSAAVVPAPAPPVGTVDPKQLDHSIGEVIGNREFAWRMPRVTEESKKGLLDSWLSGAIEMVTNALHKMWHQLGRLWHWIWDHLHKGDQEASESRGGFPFIREIFYLLLAVACGVIGWAGFRAWGNRQREVIDAEALPALPDLNSEDVAADQLPEDGWLQFTRELMERGEFRLAMRAAYLAGLAHLGQRELLTIARHKSNRDYSRELQRRARSRDDLLSAFAENLLAFERSWYGRHEVTHESLAQFTQNLEKMRTC